MRNTTFIRILITAAVFATTPSFAADRPMLRMMQLSGPARVIQWHPGVAATELQAAQIVRIAPGFRAADISQLRDDQMIETPSGNRVAVSKMRLIQKIVEQERAKTEVRRAGQFQILPRSFGPCTKPAPGETREQLLARPPSDIICTPAGKGVSVAQLRLIAPTIQQRPQFQMRSARMLMVNGPAIPIASRADLRAQIHTNLKNAPDSTVLVSPQGTRVTIGDLKALLKSHATLPMQSIGGRAQ